MATFDIDLGAGVSYQFLAWRPDRGLNPQFADIPDDPKTGLIIKHTHPDGSLCEGSVTFDTPANRALNARALEKGMPQRPLWTVVSWDPLTLSPSILRRECGFHGYIKAGRWESC